MMADGYTRASGKMSMMIAQNGPGITNFVTAVKTAYWNHTPLLLVTPQAANKTMGQGGFQEVEQMALFKDMVAYQEEVRDPSRMAEVLNRVIHARQARLRAGADQRAARFLDPGDRHRAAGDRRFRAPRGRRRGASPGRPRCCPRRSSRSSSTAPAWCSPMRIGASMALAERLDAPVCCGYQHNDAFPGSHPLFAGPLGYNGSKAAMELIAQGRRRAGARHAAQPVLHAARLRHRLLAEERGDHPGRHQPRPDRPDQAGHASASSATRRRWPTASWRACRTAPAMPAAPSARR